MLPSAGVQEPQRVFWLVTQRTVRGRARPSKYCSDRRSARAVSSASPRHPAALLGGELVEHHAHPALLLGLGHPGRDEHDRTVTLAIGGHGPAAARAPADFDGALRWVGGHASTLPAAGRRKSRPSGGSNTRDSHADCRNALFPFISYA